MCLALLGGAGLALGSVNRRTVFVGDHEHSSTTAPCTGRGKGPTGVGFSGTTDQITGVIANTLLPAKKSVTAAASNVGIANGVLRVTALCGSVPKHPAQKVHRSKSVAVPVGKSATATVKCPSGTAVVLPGFKTAVGVDETSGPATVPTAIRRRSARTLSVTAHNEGFTAGSVKAYAVCGKAFKVKTVHATATETDPGGGLATATAKCPGHRKLAFGGFNDNGAGGVYIHGYEPSSNSVAVTTFSFEPASVTAFAYCER